MWNLRRGAAVLALVLISWLMIAIACGGSSTQTPTSPSNSPLTLAPASVTLSAGGSQTFTASGGDGWNYVWTPVQPEACFSSDILVMSPPKQMRVTMLCKPSLSSTTVRVECVYNGQIVAATAIINVR